MDRRAFIAGCFGLLTAPLAADAQPAKPARIGVLATGAVPEFETFREGLRELGHIESQTYTIEARYSAAAGRFSELVVDLVRSQVDLILAIGVAARAAKVATATIPVLFVVGDPVADGLVASFNRPGGNLTGFAVQFEDLNSKWAELLRDVFPHLRRVAYLFTPQSRSFQLARFQAAAATVNLDVLPLEVREAAGLDAAFAAAARQRAETITQNASPFFDNQRSRMIALAARYRLPALYYDRGWVEAGGLMSYGPDLRVLWRRVAVYADRILKGAKPADLPVEQPTKFELVINLKTAKALGLTIPPSVLARADDVIQ